MKYIKPSWEAAEFHCPICGVYSDQIWEDIREGITTENHGSRHIPTWKIAFCKHCKGFSFWKEERLIYPDRPNIPLPNEDLEKDIQKDYSEAASIVEKSPRAAAALLRLAIQKLCKQLGEKGKDINTDIKKLVKKGLPVTIQQALDIVRVIGNDAVHPGEINLDDNKDIAYKLFDLVNIIAQTMITNPREVSRLYLSLPEKKLKSIKSRDA